MRAPLNCCLLFSMLCSCMSNCNKTARSICAPRQEKCMTCHLKTSGLPVLNLYVTATVKHLHEKIITMETKVYGCLKMERSMRGAHFRNKYSHLLKFFSGYIIYVNLLRLNHNLSLILGFFFPFHFHNRCCFSFQELIVTRWVSSRERSEQDDL